MNEPLLTKLTRKRTCPSSRSKRRSFRNPGRVEITGEDMFDAFLDGLQISRAELHPSLDTAEAMRNAGEVLREFVAGAEKLLESRAT